MINLINKLLFLLHLPLITFHSPYTKEERNKIYKLSLKCFKILVEKGHPIIGLCTVIPPCVAECGLLWYGLKALPEIYVHKNYEIYWWNMYKKEPRIKALERAIKLTE